MTERERFEAWYQQHEETIEMWASKQIAWQAWQACCPAGWQVVPVDITDAMTRKAREHFDPYEADADHIRDVWADLMLKSPSPGDG